MLNVKCVECGTVVTAKQKNKRFCTECLNKRKIATSRSWIENNYSRWLVCMRVASKKWSDKNPDKVNIYRLNRLDRARANKRELPTNCKMCNAPIVAKNCSKKWCDDCKVEMGREYSIIYNRYLKLKSIS